MISSRNILRFPRTLTYGPATRRLGYAALTPPRMHHRVIITASRCAAHGTAAPVRCARPARTQLPPLFEDAVRTRVTGKFSKDAEVFARTPETSWAALGAPRRDSCGSSGTKAGVLYMPLQALVVYSLVAIFTNAILAVLNVLGLLTPVLLRDLASALDASLTNAAGVLIEASREQARRRSCGCWRRW